MKIEVNHHPDSEEYIKKVFSMYTETDKAPDYIKGKCIIHMYPVLDTIVNGIYNDLEGFVDAYNCEVHIYNCTNKIVYKTKHHDQIDIKADCRVRIFKDISTMVIFDGGVRISYGQSIQVLPLL